MIQTVIALYVVGVAIRLALFIAKPDPARLRLFVPITCVGALTVIKAVAPGLDRTTGVINLSDLLYSTFCIAAVGTTLSFISTLHWPYKASPRSNYLLLTALLTLIPATVIEWLAGPHHLDETPQDGAVWQDLTGANWIVTGPYLLYVTGGVIYAGIAVLKYARQASDRTWSLGLVLMGTGIEFAAAGDLVFLIRIATSPGGSASYSGLTFTGTALQYGAFALFSAGWLSPLHTLISAGREVWLLGPLWTMLTTIFPGRALATGPTRSIDDLQAAASRRFLEIVESLRLLTLGPEHRALLSTSQNPVHTLASALATVPIHELWDQRSTTDAATLIYTGAALDEQKSRTLHLAKAYRSAAQPRRWRLQSGRPAQHVDVVRPGV